MAQAAAFMLIVYRSRTVYIIQRVKTFCPWGSAAYEVYILYQTFTFASQVVYLLLVIIRLSSWLKYRLYISL